MKALIWFSLLLLCFHKGAEALDCYTYQVNSYDGVPDNIEPTLRKCEKENANMCVTLTWISDLPNAGAVTFEEGLCSTHSVCKSFCAALTTDPTVGHMSNHCQQQCCNHSGCNMPKTKHFSKHNN